MMIWLFILLPFLKAFGNDDKAFHPFDFPQIIPPLFSLIAYIPALVFYYHFAHFIQKYYPMKQNNTLAFSKNTSKAST